MKKSKKNTPRPRWLCKSCGRIWVNTNEVCTRCGTAAEPLNESAVKWIAKHGGAEWTNRQQ
ncbi:MAG: hypothetical protein IIZ73_10125 [Ruminococcus sp.]|nr:hypothetical protein [Ruminococcus sp.]